MLSLKIKKYSTIYPCHYLSFPPTNKKEGRLPIRMQIEIIPTYTKS